MAIRQMRINDDPILRKKAREITEINDRIKMLAQDMIETMYDQQGVGPVVMINPELIKTEGEIVGEEACLSFPDQSGMVARPEYAVAQYTDLDGNRCEVEGHELMARAICHELDHLDGVIFLDRVIEE
jgi:peptide deformylase